MEGREEGDPGYDDWFDEPEPLTETQSGVTRGVYDDAEEVWVLPEDDEPGDHGHREVVLFGRTLTWTQVAIIAACVLALFFAILAAAGVFSSSPSAPPVTTPTTPPPTVTVTAPATTTTPTTEAPAQTLSPGDTGAQVKLLQQALNQLGYSVGTPDGSYGPATQQAVEKFQSDHNLGVDGVVGEQTLAALRQALAAQ
jgi:putative peptidoglycan binding protein